MQTSEIIKKFKANLPAGILFVLYCTLLFVIGPISFVRGNIQIVSLHAYMTIIFFIFTIAGLMISIRTADYLRVVLLAVSAVSFLIALSDWPRRHYASLEGLKYAELSLLAIFLVSAVLYFLNRFDLNKVYKLLPFLAPLILGAAFMRALHFQLLFSDDHPTFLFRLITIKESFPNIPSFNPLWNAGIDFRDFFASGALAIFLLFSPLIAIFEVATIYNLILVLLLFFLPVLASYLCCKFLKLDKGVFLISSLLCLAPSTLWFRWAVSFGTLGFILASILLPFVIAFFFKLADKNSRFTLTEVLLSIALISLMLLWPISILFLPPLLLFCCLNIKSIASKKISWIFLLALLAINIPWMLTFKEVSKVESFITNPTPGKKLSEETPINEPVKSVKNLPAKKSFKQYLGAVKQVVQASNPAIVMLGLVGLIFLPGGQLKLIYSFTLAWLCLLGTAGSTFKPQLELDRFLVTAGYLLSLPAAVAVTGILSYLKARRIEHAIVFVIFNFLIVIGLVSSYRTVSNLTLNKFYPKEKIVDQLSDNIMKFSGGGRVIFPGFILHELSNGHLAPLVNFSRVPLIARSYKHDHWTFQDVIPMRYMKDRGKRLEEFFDLYNVTAVVTSERKWRDYFKSRKNLYKEEWHAEKFRIFRRLNASNTYFLEGDGEIIEQKSSYVNFKLKSKDAVLKFNYLPKLKASGCEVDPFYLEGAVNLLALRNCPVNTEIRLSY